MLAEKKNNPPYPQTNQYNVLNWERMLCNWNTDPAWNPDSNLRYLMLSATIKEEN